VDDQNGHRNDLGAFIRAQRQLANLSLRQMATLAKVSNPYLSQLERGLHEPSMRVLQAIASALDLSTSTLLEQAGLLDDEADRAHADTEAAIRADDQLTFEQKEALITVYRSYARANRPEPAGPAPEPEPGS
jgi:transcriptional regulator with XRE-family HTH domain